MSGRNLGLLLLALLVVGAAGAWWVMPSESPDVAPATEAPPQPDEPPASTPAAVVAPPALRATDRPTAAPAARANSDLVRVAGRVLGREDVPLSGAQVRAELLRDDHILAVATATTGSDGGYALPVILSRRHTGSSAWREAARLRVIASARGHWPGRAETAVGAGGEPVALDLRLQRGSVVSVRVVAPQGRVLSNLQARLLDEGAARSVLWQSDTQPEAAVGADRFVIPITTAGPRTLEAAAEGGGTGSFGPFLVDPSADVLLPDLLLVGDGRIAGQVVHVSGPAFEGLPLCVEADPATQADAAQPGVVAGTVHSGLGGRFDCTGLRPGRYRVRPSGEPAHEDDPWIPTGTVAARVVVARTRLQVWTDALDGGGLTIACWSFVGEALAGAQRAELLGKGVPEGLRPLVADTVPLDRPWSTLVVPGSLLFLRLSARDGRRAEEWVQIPTGGATDHWAHLVLPGPIRDGEGSAVELRLAGGGAWLPGTRARLLSVRRQTIVASFAPGPSGGVLVAPRAPAGSHRLVVEASSAPDNRMLDDERTVEVKRGGVTALELQPVLGGRVQLTVVALATDGTRRTGPILVRTLVARSAAGTATVSLGECVVVAADGQWSASTSFTSGAPFLCGRAVAAGRRLIELDAESCRPASVAVDVVAGQVVAAELVLHARR